MTGLSTFTQQYIHKSKYSRFLDLLQRRETWEETVDRYLGFLKKQLLDKHNYSIPLTEYHDIRNAIINLEVMPSMRALMTAGDAAERDNTSCYNCAYTAIDDPIVFSEAMFILMCGTGLGFSAEKDYVKTLPVIQKFKDFKDTDYFAKLEHLKMLGAGVNDDRYNSYDIASNAEPMSLSEALDHIIIHFGSGKQDHHIEVEDSKEGWSLAYRALINFLYQGVIPTIDTSKIRPKGSRLKTFGGRASGPEPLRELMLFTIDVFIKAQGRRLKPIETHDLMCKIAEIVVVGGVRRCSPKGTKVHTTSGYTNIEDIEVGDYVVTPVGNRRVNKVFKQGVQRTVKINHTHGFIECTPNHRVAVFDSVFTYTFKEAQHLTSDDRLVFYNKEVLFDKEQTLPESKHERSKHDHVSPEFVLPEFNEDLAWFLGLFAGDGCARIDQRPKPKKGFKGDLSLPFPNEHEEMMLKAKGVLESFGYKVGLHDAGTYKVLRVTSIELAKWFQDNVKKPHQPIRVPEFIKKASPEIRWAFLAGVFDADGSSKNRKQPVLVSTVYQEFAQDITDLFKSLGVLAYYKMKERKEENWQDIGDVKTKGTHNYEKIAKGFSKSMKYSHTISPMDVGGHSFSKKTKDIELYVNKSLYASSKSVTARLLEQESDLSLEYLPVKVVSVEDYRDIETFDIEVEEVHHYVSEGFVTHNSALISLSDLSDSKLAKAKSGKWWETNNHRALANNSAVYYHRPSKEEFDKEWKNLKDSNSGERGIVNRLAMEKIAASNGRREFYAGMGTNPCCLSGNSLLLTENGYKRMDELVGKRFNIVSGIDGTLSESKVWEVGRRGTVTVTFSVDGITRTVTCTPEHRFKLIGGKEVEAAILNPHDRLERFPSGFSEVVSVEYSGVQTVYDFTEPKHNWGVVNGLVTHNSEIILRSRQFCNLTEAVVRQGDTEETLTRKVRLAAILGTYQSTLVYFPFLGERWTANTAKERLLGVSLTGIFDEPDLLIRNKELPKLLQNLKQVAVGANLQKAPEIGIPVSAAVTCVKPSGTVSQLVNSASGLHGRHAQYYIRRFKQDNKDPLTQYMKDIGIPWEPDLRDLDNAVIFSTYVKAPGQSIRRDEVTAIEHLELWLTYQRHWCEHKPSVTISLKDDEWEEVGEWVFEHFDEMSGVSFLPFDGGSYKQAPYEEITEEQYLEGLKLMPSDPSILDHLVETDDNVEGTQTLACTGGNCEI